MNRNFLPFLTLKIFSLFCASSVFGKDVKRTFLRQFVAHQDFYSPVYNVISCHDSDGIGLVKAFSENLQKFATLRGMEKELSAFVEEPQSFILDLQCSKSAEILKQAENLNLFGKPFKWLLLSDGADEGENSAGNKTSWSGVNLEDLKILIDSDVKIAERKEEEKMAITGVYKLATTSLIEEPLAEWSCKKGFVTFNSNVSAIRRWNLRGIKMSASVTLTRPNSIDHLEDLVDKYVDTTSKVAYNVVNLYADLFNISITYKVVKDWGEYINGSWTGVVGDLDRGEIEFGAAPVFFRKDRIPVVDYYAMVTPTKFKFIFLSPPLSYSSNIFLMPFDTIVWWCCFGVVATSCFLLFMALKFEKAGGKQSGDISFSEILILNIGAICLQGTVAKTERPPGRIITLFVYLTYMFLYISYSAAIVAILQSSDTSIESLTDLLKSPLKAGAEDVPYSRHYFQTAEDEVRKAIYRTKIVSKGNPPNFLSVEEGIKQIRKGFYAYHVELSAGYQIIQKTFLEEEKCALQELKGAFIPFSDPWLVMRKKSRYAELFKIGVKRCIERGFKSRFDQRYYTKKPTCTSKSSRFVSVGMVDCYHAFVLLLSGTVLAVSIMVLEVSFSKYLKRQERHKMVNNNKISPKYMFLN